jgi:hypothetical protein
MGLTRLIQPTQKVARLISSVRPRCARPYGELRVRTRPISPTTR